MASTGIDLSNVVWRKSSYSNGTGGECVEVSDTHPGIVPVRDSKKPHNGPVLLFRPLAWSFFLDSLKG
ncbi:toxin [Streptomyces hygroscopicus subsp. limoneus]|nr:toxin [Streptomyces hygroscopicus subsp. limoneus]